MTLLVDYSKRRAVLVPTKNGTPTQEISFKIGYDDSLASLLDDSAHTFAADHHDCCSSNVNPTKPQQPLDCSNGTASTVSESEFDFSFYQDSFALDSSVSFRIKRASSRSILTSSQESQQLPEEQPVCRPSTPTKPRRGRRNNLSRNKSDPSLPGLQRFTPDEEQSPFRRTHTLPSRADSGDALAWKRKRKTLLSASALLVSLSDRDLYQQPGRRGSMSCSNHSAPPGSILCSSGRRGSHVCNGICESTMMEDFNLGSRSLSLHDLPGSPSPPLSPTPRSPSTIQRPSLLGASRRPYSVYRRQTSEPTSAARYSRSARLNALSQTAAARTSSSNINLMRSSSIKKIRRTSSQQLKPNSLHNNTTTRTRRRGSMGQPCRSDSDTGKNLMALRGSLGQRRSNSGKNIMPTVPRRESMGQRRSNSGKNLMALARRGSVGGQAGMSPKPRRRGSLGNLRSNSFISNEFVTGSRIRRLDTADSSSKQLLGYR